MEFLARVSNVYVCRDISCSPKTAIHRQHPSRIGKARIPTTQIRRKTPFRAAMPISASASSSFGYRSSEGQVVGGSNPNQAADVGENSPAGVFRHGAALFKSGNYYKCHDVMEELWHETSHGAERTIIQGILQCSVGIHHLLTENHRGAMLELGEGISRLQGLRLADGPILRFEDGMNEVLEFLYRSQMENSACQADECAAMVGDDESYNRLGNFARGESLYELKEADGVASLWFMPRHRAHEAALDRINIPPIDFTYEDLSNY